MCSDTTLVIPVLETEPIEAPTLVGAPPTFPALLKNDPRLPRPLRLAVHDENIARANRYVAAYRAYVLRYRALVDDARSLEEVRDLGDVAPLLVPSSEPGIDLDGDEDLVADFRRRVERADDRPALRAVHEKTFALRNSF